MSIDISNTTAELPDQNVLYCCYYRANSDERQDELNFCLKKNLECKSLERIVLLCEGEIIPNIKSNNICIVKIEKRPTYRDIFNYAKTFNSQGYNIFINSDIFITDEAIEGIRQRIPKYSKNFLALTRWNWHNGTPEMNEGWDSQDTWAWFGVVPDSIKADFGYGVGGCDNSIAHHLSKHYHIMNPSLSVKTYHVHASGERTYTGKDRIPPPYKVLPITK